MEKRRSILHVDMDSFFASCEQANNPELRGAPLIVGGDPQRRSGIVLAASYDAKKFGVKTTMSIFEAAKLCPSAKIITPSHGLYERMSQGVMAIFDDFTPLKEQVSVDEAFLDMTGTEGLFGDIEAVSHLIQERIRLEMDLSCSIGISSNKLLAKMASDYRKPYGITAIYPENLVQMIWPMAVGKLYGVGKKTVPKLKEIGIHTIGDLAKANANVLNSYFGNAMTQLLLANANGIDDSQVTCGEYSELKSVGNEITFSKDLFAVDEIKQVLLTLCDKVTFRLRKKMVQGRTVSIKIKYNDFSVITRSKTIQRPTDSTDIVFGQAMELFLHNRIEKPIRLLGVTVTNFEQEESCQLSLFEPENEVHKTDQMVDEIRKKHGYGAIQRAGSFIRKKAND